MASNRAVADDVTQSLICISLKDRRPPTDRRSAGAQGTEPNDSGKNDALLARAEKAFEEGDICAGRGPF